MARIVLKNVRTSYCFLLEPSKLNGEKYSTQLIIGKNHPQYKELVKTVLETAKEKWPEMFKKTEGKWPKALSYPIHDGEERIDHVQYEDVYKDNMYFNCSSKLQPALFDRAKRQLGKEMTQEEAVKYFYSGAMINASLSVFAYDSNGNKGVSFGINGAQFKADNDKLGGIDVSNDFEDEDEDSEDLTDLLG